LKRIVMPLCALAFVCSEAQAQVSPLWSVPLGSSRPARSTDCGTVNFHIDPPVCSFDPKQGSPCAHIVSY